MRKTSVWALSVVGVAAGLAYFLSSDSSRPGVLAGVLAAGVSSGFALQLKRLAVRKSLNAALAVLGAVFFVRLMLAAVGTAKGGMPFVVGFFSTYFPLQAVEIKDVLDEHERFSG